MPLVQQTVAMLPACILPEAMPLLSGVMVIWCFGDQSLRPKTHGSLSTFILSADTAMLSQAVNVF